MREIRLMLFCKDGEKKIVQDKWGFSIVKETSKQQQNPGIVAVVF